MISMATHRVETVNYCADPFRHVGTALPPAQTIWYRVVLVIGEDEFPEEDKLHKTHREADLAGKKYAALYNKGNKR